jgi:hypothetical protein
MSSNAAPKSGFICLKPLYDFIRKHKREYLQALNTGFLAVLLVIVGLLRYCSQPHTCQS